MPDFPFFKPRLLASSDPVAGFDCGVEELNRYLHKHAYQAQAGDGARSYVSLSGSVIAGYYTLAYGCVEFGAAPSRVTKGLARHPVPEMLLARLAVERKFSGRGLGKELLRDALLRTLAAADIAGLRAVVVDAKDEAAKGFYENFHFEPFADHPMRLALILKDVRAMLRD
ncbi:MAG: GNAT family N-acetyltransferase [Verrucomicrobiales bacterium]